MKPFKGWRRTILSLLCDVALVYIVIVAAMFLGQRMLVYRPTHFAPAPARANAPDMQVIAVHTADGLTLAGWYKPPAAPDKPVIVFFHGNGGEIASRIYRLRDFMTDGDGLLLAEYRGYGANPGRPTEDGLYMDARAYLAWLTGRGIARDRVVLFGESLGTGVAVQMAAENPGARALVLEAPYTTLPEIGAAEYPFIPVRLLMFDRFDSRAKIGSVHMPILIVHGQRDTIVPVRFGRALFDAAPAPKKLVLLPGAGHNDLYENKAYDAVFAFLNSLPPEKH